MQRISFSTQNLTEKVERPMRSVSFNLCLVYACVCVACSGGEEKDISSIVGASGSGYVSPDGTNVSLAGTGGWTIATAGMGGLPAVTTASGGTDVAIAGTGGSPAVTAGSGGSDVATAGVGGSSEKAGNSDTETSEDSEQDRFDALLSFMRDELKENDVPGGAIAIVKDGELKFSAGVGVKREGDSDPVNAETKFVVGSISKMITAAGLMTLVDENLLDLDAPVTDYVPSFKLQAPFDPSTITVRQLLTHTSGIPDYAEVQCDTDSKALSNWFENNTDQPLWSTPGTIWNYSNLGYSLVGLVLEKVAGKPFAQVIQERIFDPLGMSAMTYDVKAAAAGNHAVGHGLDGNQQRLFVEIDTFDCALTQPPGYIFGDVLGMARFAEMQLSQGGDVLSAQSVAEMQAPHVETRKWPNTYYGYGIMDSEYKDLEVKWHGGALDGYRTDWLIVPDKNFGVVVFLNALNAPNGRVYDSYDPHVLSLKALDIFLDLPDEEPPDYSTPPETWTKYIGSYYQKHRIKTETMLLPPYTVEVSQDSDLKLWVNVPEQGLIGELTQVAGDFFLADLYLGNLQVLQFPITFWLNDQGVSQYLVTRLGVGERMDDHNF